MGHLLTWRTLLKCLPAALAALLTPPTGAGAADAAPVPGPPEQSWTTSKVVTIETGSDITGMQVHDGNLYVATADGIYKVKEVAPSLRAELLP